MVRLSGLEATTEIYRDRYGIPHVKAETVHDAFFGQGFATAQDRLWQMDYDRLRAYGRLAEHLGRPTVEADKVMRRFQLAKTVERDYHALDRETKSNVDAFAAGVNAFIDTAKSLAVEYQLLGRQPAHWRASDSLAVQRVRQHGMGVFSQKLWRSRLVTELGPDRAAKLVPSHQAGYLLIVPPGDTYRGDVRDAFEALSRGAAAVASLWETDGGSNNWALSGERTRSGKPLVGGDPHRILDVPNLYYQTHIACPEFDAIGLTFPGVPGFPNFGHNAHVAWCITHAAADVEDLYVERFSREDPTLYELDGAWLQADVIRETISVRDGAPVTLEVIVTRHGPVIAGDPATGHAIALQDTPTCGPNTTLVAVRQMLAAKSADELEETMRAWVAPPQNFVYADVHGNIGYLLRGRLPIRHPANAWLPVPGWTGEHDWRGYVPFEELPRSRNPGVGYLVTANNKIVGHEYPHYIALEFAPDHRAQRLSQRLASLHDATAEDVTMLHKDAVSIPARTYQQLLRNVRPNDPFVAAAHRLLLEWDGAMEREQPAPAIYAAFRRCLDRILVRHLLGQLAEEALAATVGGPLVHVRRLSAYFVRQAALADTTLLPEGADWSSLATATLSEAVQDLRKSLGEDMASWQWGSVHFTRPRHPLSLQHPELAAQLDPPSVPMSGDAGDTPLASACAGPDPSIVTAVSAARYIFDTNDWENSAWVVPFGASGHPGSKHYADQVGLWAGLELAPMLFSWERIEASAESMHVLAPARRDGKGSAAPEQAR